MHKIADLGGALACIESGYFATKLSDSAYETARAIDSGERKVVGVNTFVSESARFEVFNIDKESEQRQIADLRNVKLRRDTGRVAESLENLLLATQAGINIVPAVVLAVKEYATVGEITNVLREVYGKWQPTSDF
jgi:methylmalonyl-CoA mutase N-terminal domain/subunit